MFADNTSFERAMKNLPVLDPFLQEINDICSSIDSRTVMMNAGGCAVFAAFMGQCLMRYGVVSIAVGDDDHRTCGTNIDVIRNDVAENSPLEWHNNGVSFGHVIVEFRYKGKTYHIDSTGVYKKASRTAHGAYKLYKGRLTVQEVTELASHERGWNWLFNRARIPDIKQMFDEEFASMFNRGYVPKAC